MKDNYSNKGYDFDVFSDDVEYYDDRRDVRRKPPLRPSKRSHKRRTRIRIMLVSGMVLILTLFILLIVGIVNLFVPHSTVIEDITATAVTDNSVSLSWKKLGKEDLSDPRYYQGTCAGKKMIGIVNREPNTSNEIMRRLYIHALDNAKDSVKIVNPYFVPTPSVMKALKRCAERGVKMDIIMSAKYDVPLTPDVVYYNMRKLIKRGVNVWRYRLGFHHSKIMMVDGKFCTVGSTNLDARSMRFDYEINALIIDPETTAKLDAKFIEDTKQCDLITMEEWNKSRSTWQRFRGWFGHLLTPFL